MRLLMATLAALVLLAGCSGGGDVTATTISSQDPPTAPTTTATAGFSITGTYTCGPGDGPAVGGTAQADEPTTVVIAVALDGDTLGMTTVAIPAAGQAVDFLVNVSFRTEADSGRVASLTMRVAAEDARVVASADVTLRSPPSVGGCG
jgi:hypothetical protein